MQNLPTILNNNQTEKEIWIKPQIEVININDETLGLGADTEKVIHFFMGS